MLYILTKQKDRQQYLPIYKSLLCRKLLVKKEQSFSEKLFVFIIYLLYPAFFLTHLKRTSKMDFAVELSSERNGSNRKSRRLFVSHYFYNEDDISHIHYLSGSSVVYHSITKDGLIEVLSIWELFLCGAWRALWSKRALLERAGLRLINIFASAALLNKDKSSFYTFRLYGGYPYFVSLFLSQYMQRKVYAITGSTYMYTKRYSYFPECIVGICADYQRVEIDNYIKKGWFVCKEVRMTGFEEYDLIKDIKPTSPIYDIGVYSSGWWARKDGMYQVTDVEEIRSMKYCNNKYQQNFVDILNTLGPYCKEKKLRVIVYPHPYERRLRNDYGIDCPYRGILNEYGFAFDDDHSTSSISKIYDCKIGVGIASTIVAQRWSLGLKAISLYDDLIAEWVDINYLGKYKQFFFKDPLAVSSVIESLIKEESL